MSDPEGKIRIINPDGQIITIHKDEIKAVDYGASIIIIKPKDENTVDLRTSCNKAVAVAKLFGWMKGSTFPKVMVPFGKGDTYLDLVRFLEEKNALQDMLSQMRDVASEELAAAEADATSEELKEKQEAVSNIDSLIKRAFTYVSDIDEELTKGSVSALKIDQQASENNGVIHITLRSLDQWAKEKYGISIMDDQEHHLSPEDNHALPITQNEEEDLDPKEGFTRIIANNFLTTFAFLVEGFAKTAPKYGQDNPNVSEIAKHIAQLAAKASGENPMKNQSYDSIRKRITQALETKKSNLPHR